eukprot:CAMPEP_0206367314 /NCGR_PEP_ID=MMETSP0294-20121207/3970_1 /ASSEMBLY_ACC=CAM_ASM_000327 /TAXON_ID=39354 /ORGANISM="Heterosigma akashiwo, Strain CCMP2393" /LENGTH=62 /DNA_ID=CAMNT_0053813539 /DNA_START=211 /DNA_END=396 /DNA_ORIENTATION=+
MVGNSNSTRRSAASGERSAPPIRSLRAEGGSGPAGLAVARQGGGQLSSAAARAPGARAAAAA